MTGGVLSGSHPPQAYGGDGQVSITAADVAARIDGQLLGDPSVLVRGVAPLDRAGPDDLSFFTHGRYGKWFATSRAGLVLVSQELAETEGVPSTRVIVARPMDAMLSLLALFRHVEPRAAGLHPTAVIAAGAVLGDGVTVDAHAVIEDGVVIGAGSWIGANTSVGAHSTLGHDVRLFPGAVVYPRTELGDRVVLHAGAQVGRDGFGFVPLQGRIERMPHVGRCVLEHDVEVGANSCIDRGSVDDTIIGAGTKLDSLVHIAHNVRVGRGCFFAAHVGIAGSTRIGDGVQFGGQSGCGGHVTIGAGATIAARGGVIGDVPAGETWSGFPARPHKEQMRILAAMARLGRMLRPLERLLARQDKS